MLIVLPVACWAVLALALVRRGRPRREAFLAAAVAWGAYLTLVTEGLSLLGALNRMGLALAWGAATLAGIGGCFGAVRRDGPPVAAPPSRSELALAGGIGLLCLAILVTALAAPPNSWDSMTYHMSRVVHWLQNESVAHYPTHIVRQIAMNPWAEFAIAHFQALSGGDRFAGLVQWFSLVGSLAAASAIAGQLGAGRRGQLLAAVVAVTIPMGILQASGTQNDYVAAFWLLCFAWAGMRVVETRQPLWAVVAGASLGLALLTKGTAYLYALPLALWFLWGVRNSPRRAALLVLSVVFPCLLLNAGHYARNWMLFSNPLGSGSSAYTNEAVAPKTLLSNLVRNGAIHLATPLPEVNRSIEAGVGAFHQALGIDPSDPGTTWAGTSFELPGYMLQGGRSGNPLHALLAAATLALLFGRGVRSRSLDDLTKYALAVTGGFLLFCLVLKWQPWHSRLHLPLFLLGAPPVGAVLGRARPAALAGAAAVLLLVAALPCALWNDRRPLAPEPRSIAAALARGGPLPPTILTVERVPQYFPVRQDLLRPFVAAARAIMAHGADQVGLRLGGDDWEYPLWAVIENEGGEVPRFEHIGVANRSGTIPLHDFRPDLIVVFGENGRPVVTVPGPR